MALLELETTVGEIALDDLRVGPSRRAGGIDPRHVQALQELGGCWPPIVIATAARTVVDGLHRVHAARALGLTRLPCVFFAGDEDDAYAEFVRCNTAHGLPLAFGEREAAARRLLRSHAAWSDRRIASTCALSPGTVARLRQASAAESAGTGCATDAGGQLHTRLGRDGRSRPVDYLLLRTRIADALRDDPQASLRGIAARVGTSPTTVRSVRAELAATEERAWAPDAAVLSAEHGAEFAEWFERTAVGDDWWAHVGEVPYGRLYDVADEARRRAAHWLAFARALEGGAQRT